LRHDIHGVILAWEHALHHDRSLLRPYAPRSTCLLGSSRRAEAKVFCTRFSLEENNVGLSFHETLYAISRWRTANPLYKEVRRLSIMRLSARECKFQPTVHWGETDPQAFCLFCTTFDTKERDYERL
jgi:hypothetical protein